jgi:hypothetical protein
VRQSREREREQRAERERRDREWGHGWEKLKEKIWTKEGRRRGRIDV